MSHINTDPGHYDFAASAHIFDLSGDEPRVIMHFHKRLKKYMHFGGHVELHENPWEAITHELVEESGYTIDQVKVLQPKGVIVDLPDAVLHPLPINMNSHKYGDQDHYHTDIAYGFVTDQKPKNEVSSELESQDFVYLTRDELAALPAEQTIENIRNVALRVFDLLLDEWEAVDTSVFE